MTSEREYTPEEANAMLPDLRRAIELIREARQVVLAGGERLERTARSNGGGEIGREYWEALNTLRREVEALSAKSIVLRDPERGLVDFPARRDGRRVFLCWLLEEDEIGFWHTPDSGFGGRQRL